VNSYRPKATKQGARTSTHAALPAILFEGKMKRLAVTLDEQFAESAWLALAVRANLKGMNHRED